MQTESGMLWGRQLLQDTHYGLRSLRFNPGFSALVILILALGIGMNTAVFSIVNAVVLNPLPYPYGERIVWMVTHSSFSLGDMVAVADFQDLQERSRSFEKMALYGYQNQAIQRAGDTLRIRVASVSGDFWNILGARAAAGRLFDPDERNSIVLSNGLFMRFFGGYPS